MNIEEIMACDETYFMNTYGRRIPVAIERGRGCRLWDTEGKEYLDFVAGIAVNALGHSHPALNTALRDQIERLIHCSSLYYIESQARLARLLVEHSCADRVFFTNSGAEANEAALKIARKYGKKGAGETEKNEIITAANSFHGRTLATLAATGQDKYKKDFTPLPPGFTTVPFNDLQALKGALNNRTCAVMLEPVQGEGGIHPADGEYLQGVQEVCRKNGLLFILDEIQTGMGRTGTLFAYERYGLEPDVFTLAKGLGNGVPIGCVLARGKAAEVFRPGDHGSTFGGNPLACTAALATLTTILEDGLCQHVQRTGDTLREGLEAMREEHGLIADIRGQGLMLGVELSKPCARELIALCRPKGLLLNAVGEHILRMLPPLIISTGEIREALEILAAGFQEWQEANSE